MPTKIKFQYKLYGKHKIFNISFRTPHITKTQHNKLREYFPGIDNVPLKVNIYRIICFYVTFNRVNGNYRHIIVPQNLETDKKIIRLIYACSGLIRGNSFAWDVYNFDEDGDTLEIFLSEYIKDKPRVEDRDRPREGRELTYLDYYVALLTNLWAFLGRTDNRSINHDLLHTIKYRLLQNNPFQRRGNVNGQILQVKSPSYDEFYMGRLIRKVQEKLEQNNLTNEWNKWNRQGGGIDYETMKKIHFYILFSFDQLLPADARVANVKYKNTIPKPTLFYSFVSNPSKLKNDVIKTAIRTGYRNYIFNPDTCSKAFIQLGESEERPNYYKPGGAHTSSDVGGNVRVTSSSSSSNGSWQQQHDDDSIISLECRKQRKTARTGSESEKDKRERKDKKGKNKRTEIGNKSGSQKRQRKDEKGKTKKIRTGSGGRSVSESKKKTNRGGAPSSV